ncbi:MAG: hypothetical protein GX358_07305 [candidate division WS1 bacterium]|nr:hypothetical protein [candidate division WS1 bacterium]
MRSPRNAKLMMVSALCLMALAGVIFLLIVLPAMRGGAPASLAQPDDLVPPPPEEGLDFPMDMPGMPPGGPAEFGPAEETPAAPDPSAKGDPIEPSSSNPFSAAALAPGAQGQLALEDMRVTNYGSDWSKIPITQQLGFPSPEVPSRKPPTPPPSVFGPEKPLYITSIMWTQDGQALAVYEFGEGPDKMDGVVRPGDVVENWKVVEIRGDHIIVEDRPSGTRTEVFLTEKAPAPAKPEPQQPRRRGTQSGRARPVR